MRYRSVIRGLGACFILAAALFGTANAQKVGYVDSKKIFAQYRGAEDVRQELNRTIEVWNREITAKRKTLDSLEKNLAEQDLVISSERRKAKREEIAQKKKELETLVHEIFDPGGKADQKNKELSKPMAEKISGLVKKVALDNNLLMILDSSSGLVVYSSKEMDITDQVLEELAKEEGTAARVLSSIAVFPVWETDAESIRKKYGTLAQDYLVSLWEKDPQLTPVTKKQIENIIKDKGLTKSEIKESRGLEMAKILNARYMTLGQITQNPVNSQITVNLKLYDVERSQMIGEENETAAAQNEIISACEKLVERINQRIIQ